MKPITIRTDYWRTNIVSLDSHGIILITPTEDVDHDIDDLKDFVKFMRAFTNNQKHYSISDLRKFHFKVTNEATRYFVSNPEIIKKIGGNAHLVSSLPNRLTINFVVNFYSPPYPFRAFGNFIEAHKWLLKLKEKDTAYKSRY